MLYFWNFNFTSFSKTLSRAEMSGRRSSSIQLLVGKILKKTSLRNSKEILTQNFWVRIRRFPLSRCVKLATDVSYYISVAKISDRQYCIIPYNLYQCWSLVVAIMLKNKPLYHFQKWSYFHWTLRNLSYIKAAISSGNPIENHKSHRKCRNIKTGRFKCE